MNKAQAQLGDLARDEITGFEGVIVAKTEWINGCVRLTLQPKKLDKDGKPVESATFDVEQIALVKAMKHPYREPAGGPMPDPVRGASVAKR